MANLHWDGDDFRNEQDSSGSTADLVSHSGKLQQGYQHGSLTKGLVAYYPMEKGEGEILNDGALDNLGQINGATWNGIGQIGNNALDFNGSTDYIDTEIKPSDIDDSVTISYWAKWPSSSSTLREFGVGDSSDNRIAVGYDQDAGGFDWFTYDGSTAYGLNNESVGLTNDTWHHITLTFDGSNYRIFVDGTKKAEAASTTFIKPNDLQIPIGAKNNNGTIKHSTNATMDDFRIYDRALSEPEIQALYNLSKPSGTQVTEKQVPNQSQGGISRYKLNGNPDDSWGSNNGTENGVTYETGVHGQAGRFQQSSSDYISIPDDGSLEPEKFTISAWVKTSKDTGSSVFERGDSSSYRYSLYKPSSESTLGLYIREDDGTIHSAKASNASNGKWAHYAGTWNGKLLRIYKNGALSEEKNVGNTNLISKNTSNSIGRYEYRDNYFNGLIDDVRLYSKALTPQKVEKLYHKGAYRIPRESTLQ